MRAVEREASWGIMKLRVDGGRVIDVGEVLAVAVVGAGPKELECILCVSSCFLACSITLYHKVP